MQTLLRIENSTNCILIHLAEFVKVINVNFLFRTKFLQQIVKQPNVVGSYLAFTRLGFFNYFNNTVIDGGC